MIRGTALAVPTVASVDVATPRIVHKSRWRKRYGATMRKCTRSVLHTKPTVSQICRKTTATQSPYISDQISCLPASSIATISGCPFADENPAQICANSSAVRPS